MFYRVFRQDRTFPKTMDGASVADASRMRPGLGRVDIHRVARTDPTSCIIAEKLSSVLSYRVAMRRNSLILQKKFSTRWRHLYISKSQGIVVTRLAFGGITAIAPRSAKSARIASLSKALSARRALKSSSVRSGATLPGDLHGERVPVSWQGSPADLR